MFHIALQFQFMNRYHKRKKYDFYVEYTIVEGRKSKDKGDEGGKEE